MSDWDKTEEELERDLRKKNDRELAATFHWYAVERDPAVKSDFGKKLDSFLEHRDQLNKRRAFRAMFSESSVAADQPSKKHP